MNMECIYRWIQMSDIHFQNKKVTFNKFCIVTVKVLNSYEK